MLAKYICKRAFKYISKANGNIPLKVVFPDGLAYKTAPGTPKLTVRFKNKAVLRRTLYLDQIGFVEGYMQGLIDVEGHKALQELIKLGYQAGGNKSKQHLRNPLSITKQLWLQFRTNNRNRRQAKVNAYQHYGLPAEFFRLFLGDTYGYTEGYYENGDESLDKSQHKKFDYICQKLRLQSGDRLVEVGAGWGYMSILAAEKYGAKVTNYGLVDEQNRVMQQKINEKGLQDSVKIVVKDHRELMSEPERYDKYVSIGVYEHAGLNCQNEWIKSIAACLKPGGIGVISTLCHMNRQRTNYFIDKYIFPGGNIPSLADTVRYLENNGLTILDIESLRWHYMRAVEDWYDLFVKNWPKIQQLDPQLFDETFKRRWSLYLIGSIEAFRQETERLNVVHIVFTKGRSLDTYPHNRKFLYQK